MLANIHQKQQGIDILDCAYNQSKIKLYSNQENSPIFA